MKDAYLNVKGEPLKLKHASKCLGIMEAHSQWVFDALKHQGLVKCAQSAQFAFPFPVDNDIRVLHIVLDICVGEVVIEVGVEDAGNPNSFLQFFWKCVQHRALLQVLKSGSNLSPGDVHPQVDLNLIFHFSNRQNIHDSQVDSDLDW